MLVWTLVWFAASLLLTGVKGQEAVAGLAGAVLAAWLQRAAARAGFGFPRLPLRRLLPCWRLPWAVLQESWDLAKALFSPGPPQGAFHQAAYQPSASPLDDVGARAVLAFGICFSPNSYVVDIDSQRRMVLLHQLVGEKIAATDQAFLEAR